MNCCILFWSMWKQLSFSMKIYCSFYGHARSAHLHSHLLRFSHCPRTWKLRDTACDQVRESLCVLQSKRERGNTLNLSSAHRHEISQMSIRRIRRLIPRKSAARWLGDDALRAAAASHSLILSDIILYTYCVLEKINKRDWFCSLCVGQENYCMYISI